MVSGIHQLFTDLKKKKEHYLGGAKGVEFEERIKAKLTNLGYGSLIEGDIKKEEKGLFTELKKQVLEKEYQHDIANPFSSYSKHFIYQPCGSQNYPDFIVLDKHKVINIEVKYSVGSQKKPVWNSGLPRLNGIYIFGAKKIRDLTFFRGGDIVSSDDIQQLHDFFDHELRQYQKQFNQRNMNDQPYGFAVYIRKTFEQKREFNSQATIDFFSNKNRQQLEDAVISYLQQ